MTRSRPTNAPSRPRATHAPSRPTDEPVRSADELTARWEAILEPPVFGARTLWLAWLDARGRMLPMLVPIEDIPLVPDVALLDGLRRVHEGIAEAHLALVLSRPGRPEITGDDDEWAEGLRETLDDRIDGSWSLHLAAGGSVVPLVEAPQGTWSGRSS